MNTAKRTQQFSFALEPAAEQLRLELAEKVKSFVIGGDDVSCQVPGLHLSYLEAPKCDLNCFYRLSVGLILQGRKNVLIGNREYRYGTGSMLLTSMDIPTSYEMVDVRPDNPFISLSLHLNPSILTELLEKDTGEVRNPEVFTVQKPALELMEDFRRLLDLLDNPELLPVRAPMLVRDIHFLALNGAGGDILRALFLPGSAGQRIRQAIRWLRTNFRESITVEDLAKTASMAPATFHRHFKAMTSLSPLQYQKRLRLYEAQQFLLRGEGDVNSAAFAVGYQSPQQFNRDYKKFFGATPGRSTKEHREGILAAALADDE